MKGVQKICCNRNNLDISVLRSWETKTNRIQELQLRTTFLYLLAFRQLVSFTHYS